MNLLQMIAVIGLLIGLGLWLAGRRKGASPVFGMAGLVSLVAGLLAGLIGAFQSEASTEELLHRRVALAQWQYPLLQVAEKMGGPGKILILSPEGAAGLEPADLESVTPAGCQVELHPVPEAGLTAALVKKAMALKPAAIILNASLPAETEKRAEFFSELGTEAPKIPMLYAAGSSQDAIELFARGLIWAHIEHQSKVDVSQLKSDASLAECFQAAHRLSLAPAAQSSPETPSGEL